MRLDKYKEIDGFHQKHDVSCKIDHDFQRTLLFFREQELQEVFQMREEVDPIKFHEDEFADKA